MAAMSGVLPHVLAIRSQEHDRFLSLMHSAGEGFCAVDRNWRITLINEEFARMFGIPRERAYGATTFELNPNWKQSVFYAACQQAMLERQPKSVVGYSERLKRHLVVRAYPFEDGIGIFMHDATQQHEQLLRSVFMARNDHLTALPNRVALDDDVTSAIAARKTFVLALIDLSRFKDINDTLGHLQGDKVLMQVGARLKDAAGERGRAYRLNGDEFVLMAESAGAERRHIEEFVSAVLARALAPLATGGIELTLAATVGIVAFPEHGSDFDTLIRRVDMAMHSAKRDRDPPIAWFDAQLEQEMVQRVSLESAIRRAIEMDQFELYYQPKADLRGMTCAGAEALLRWQHPGMGVVSPGTFMPVAEECGLAQQLDRWVLKRAFADVSRMCAAGLRVPVSINLSARSIGRADLADYVDELLRHTKVPPELIELEITEGALMRDVDASRRSLEQIHALGVRFSVDDFGTGYSSMAYLTRFPVGTLKVDRTFVSDMLTNSSNRNIVKGVIALAHSLGMRVVAEGVETREQLDQLALLDCDMVQGYYFERPMPLDLFVAFAAGRRSEALHGDIGSGIGAV
jgi:diguanylate cyclase (GGDEF)-like protein/PAS domain S-box-containing protein